MMLCLEPALFTFRVSTIYLKNGCFLFSVSILGVSFQQELVQGLQLAMWHHGLLSWLVVPKGGKGAIARDLAGMLFLSALYSHRLCLFKEAAQAERETVLAARLGCDVSYSDYYECLSLCLRMGKIRTFG